MCIATLSVHLPFFLFILFFRFNSLPFFFRKTCATTRLRVPVHNHPLLPDLPSLWHVLLLLTVYGNGLRCYHPLPAVNPPPSRSDMRLGSLPTHYLSLFFFQTIRLFFALPYCVCVLRLFFFGTVGSCAPSFNLTTLDDTLT